MPPLSEIEDTLLSVLVYTDFAAGDFASFSATITSAAVVNTMPVVPSLRPGWLVMLGLLLIGSGFTSSRRFESVVA